MKHPILRTSDVPHEDFLVALEKLGRDIIKLLPATFTKEYGNPTDLELVGSYSNNCARLHSDVDLGLPMKDWNGQMALRRLLNDRQDIATPIRQLIAAFDETWGIVKTDFNPAIPDNKLNPNYATYSVFERKLYGKPADLIKQYLKMDNTTQRYTLRSYTLAGVPVDSRWDTPLKDHPMKWAYDEWADEVPKWKEIYGDKFQEP
jgi:hypothetical protein